MQIDWIPHTIHVALVQPPGPVGKIKECLQFTISGDDDVPPTWVPGVNHIGPAGISESKNLGTFPTFDLAKEAARQYATKWYQKLSDVSPS